MEKYLVLAFFIRFLVDFMLIMAAGKVFGRECGIRRGLLASSAGCLWAALSMLPQLRFLQNPIGYGLGLILTGGIGFGVKISAFHEQVAFVLLRVGLDGLGLQQNGLLKMISLMLLSGVILYVVWEKRRFSRYIPVQLFYQGRELRFQALWDSGHTLRDPVTGNTVLIVGADVADELTGLTAHQLRTPIETMGVIPGLRLIPYQTVDSCGNMLLAMQLKNAKIGRKRGTYLVAFAPQVLDCNGKFQALIGGSV